MGGRRLELARGIALSVGGKGERRSGCCCARERESESARGGARLAAGAKADAAGRTWWPTRARPSRRMRATWRPSSAGVPRRRGAAVRVHGRGAGAGAGKGASAGGLGRLRPAGQK